MSRLRFCLLLAVLGSCSELGHGDTYTTQKPILIPVDSKTMAHSEVANADNMSVKQEIALNTTTLKPTTNTTLTPDTPTNSTTTTTHSPDTTTKSTTTTTTLAPDTTTKSTTTTTTSPPPTPTPIPTPLPPPTQGNWSYTDLKNVTCVVVQFAAQLNVTYNKSVNNSTFSWNVLINVPTQNVTVNGSCTGDQWLELSWLTNNMSTVPNTFTLVYHNNETTKNYGLKSLNISLAPDNFANASSADPIVLWHGPEWLIPLATSYRCKTPTQLNLTSEANGVAATLTLSRLQEEAYRTAPGKGFSAARECSGGDVPDAVPIAVGCALGGLVVVVLIAYLVGRRRSAARGYLSM